MVNKKNIPRYINGFPNYNHPDIKDILSEYDAAADLYVEKMEELEKMNERINEMMKEYLPVKILAENTSVESFYDSQFITIHNLCVLLTHTINTKTNFKAIPFNAPVPKFNNLILFICSYDCSFQENSTWKDNTRIICEQRFKEWLSYFKSNVLKLIEYRPQDWEKLIYSITFKLYSYLKTITDLTNITEHKIEENMESDLYLRLIEDLDLHLRTMKQDIQFFIAKEIPMTPTLRNDLKKLPLVSDYIS